jgi:NAD-dependent oxidoreductase involved in siderophore biosynthesis
MNNLKSPIALAFLLIAASSPASAEVCSVTHKDFMSRIAHQIGEHNVEKAKPAKAAENIQVQKAHFIELLKKNKKDPKSISAEENRKLNDYMTRFPEVYIFGKW